MLVRCGNDYSIASQAGSGCFVRVKPGNPVIKPPKFPPIPPLLHPDRAPRWVTTHVSDPLKIIFLQAWFEGWPVAPYEWVDFEAGSMLFMAESIKIQQMCIQGSGRGPDGMNDLQLVHKLFKQAGWQWNHSNMLLWLKARPEDFTLEVIPPPEGWFSASTF